MSLNTLRLFSNVRITPDYSVVHDMDPVTWSSYLINPPNTDTDPPVLLYAKEVNFYRLPDSVRIEANYDTIRKATYGYLETIPEAGVSSPSFGRIFFWVNDVRLVTQRTRTDEGVVLDTVLLDVSLDVWSTYGRQFALYDSFVERRHMPRWVNNGTDLSPDWQPIYYPNASQGVEGAYVLEDRFDTSESFTLTNPAAISDFDGNTELDPRYIVVTAVNKDGEFEIRVGLELFGENGKNYPVYTTGSQYLDEKHYFGLTEVLDGTIFSTDPNDTFTADNVQSIVILPYLSNWCPGGMELKTVNILGMDKYYMTLNTTDASHFVNWRSLTADANQKIYYMTFSIEAWRKIHAFREMMMDQTVTPSVIAPDHDNIDGDGTSYDEMHEPMMYLSPARIRKMTSAFGGEVFTIPDIAAFSDSVTLKNIIDLNSAITYVFAGSDLESANAIGALGVLEAATLPIYNSAWKSYEAINKIGDEIAYNAKQMQTLANGAAGTASSAIVGTAINPVAGVAGLITGIVGTAAGMYGNAEELRGKQVTIKNSPANVKSGGSGLGAYIIGLIDVHYLTFRMDDQSMQKLRFMYYWFGYFVNRTFKGEVSLHTRSKFDFIKTNGAKVKGDLTASAAKQIASIFDSGVSIYHGPDGYREIGSGNMIANDEV